MEQVQSPVAGVSAGVPAELGQQSSYQPAPPHPSPDPDPSPDPGPGPGVDSDQYWYQQTYEGEPSAHPIGSLCAPVMLRQQDAIPSQSDLSLSVFTEESYLAVDRPRRSSFSFLWFPGSSVRW